MAELDIDSLWREHGPRIHRAALVLCGDPWDADDLAQETFLAVAQQSGAFRQQSRVYTYLYGILLNLDRQRRRRRQRRGERLRVFHETHAAAPPDAPSAAAPLEAREWRHSLWSQVAELPEGQRHALVLRFSEGLRYEEIAETLNCPLGTVKSRIFHGLSRLREAISPRCDEFQAPSHPQEGRSHVS